MSESGITGLMGAPVASIRLGASVVAIVSGAALLSEAASAGQRVPGETAVIEMGRSSDTWLPSVEYAKTAVSAIREGGAREARMVDGYVKLPIRTRTITWHMEEWLGPIRRFYSSDLSDVDYTAISSDHADAILEIGVLNYEYFSERLVLQVFVRLVDPHTRRVLARTRHASHEKTGPLGPLLQNDAEGMRRLILETGNRLLGQCLADIRLASDH